MGPASPPPQFFFCQYRFSATLAPSRQKRRAVAAPIPLPPPVIIAILPSSRPAIDFIPPLVLAAEKASCVRCIQSPGFTEAVQDLQNRSLAYRLFSEATNRLFGTLLDAAAGWLKHIRSHGSRRRF